MHGMRNVKYVLTDLNNELLNFEGISRSVPIKIQFVVHRDMVNLQ
jgi:hypothetical protein